MRHLSLDEAQVVGGAACSDLSVSVGLTGISVSGSLGDWLDCFNVGYDFVNGLMAHISTGIPYGEPHVG